MLAFGFRVIRLLYCVRYLVWYGVLVLFADGLDRGFCVGGKVRMAVYVDVLWHTTYCGGAACEFGCCG